MNKNVKLFVVMALVLLLGVGAAFVFLNFKKNEVEQQAPIFPENPQKGDFGYRETKTTVSIGTDGIFKGTLEKIEAGDIFFNVGSDLVQYGLTVDEVVVSCTTQDLDSATELDYNLVTNIIVTNPDELGQYITAGDELVAFSDDVEGVLRVHTIAIDASKCPSD